MKNLFLLLIIGAIEAFSQAPRATLRSVGVPDFDGTVVYGVYIASGNDALEHLTVTAAVPPGTRFLENLDTPSGGIYEGVQDNVVMWRFPKLERDSILGPFNFRGKVQEGALAPDSVKSALAYEKPETELIESTAPGGTLRPLSLSGSIVVDQRGTLNESGEPAAVLVGDTGIQIFVPRDAVDAKVTLSVDRVPATSLTPTPGTWWCSAIRVRITDGTSNITVQRAAAISAPIAVQVPARRPLPPGVPGTSSLLPYIEQDDPAMRNQGKTPDRALGFGPQASGQQCVSQFGFISCRTTGFCQFQCGFGFGVDSEARDTALITGRQLAELTGLNNTAAGFLESPLSFQQLVQKP